MNKKVLVKSICCYSNPPPLFFLLRDGLFLCDFPCSYITEIMSQLQLLSLFCNGISRFNTFVLLKSLGSAQQSHFRMPKCWYHNIYGELMNRILEIVLLIVVSLKACCTKSHLSWIQDFQKMNGKRKLVGFAVDCIRRNGFYKGPFS